MKPISNKLTTSALSAPSDWRKANGSCISLPVCHAHAENNFPLVFSWWRLTWRERLLALLGYPVKLCIVGRTHAPVALEVDTQREAQP